VGYAMEVSTFNTHPRDVRSVPGRRLACWFAGRPTQNLSSPRRKFSDQSFRGCEGAMSDRRDPFTNGHDKKTKTQNFWCPYQIARCR
jgi:hypothetical protein